MSIASKDQRVKLYKERNVQLLISKFVSGELTELNPVYDPKYGYKYPVVDAILGDPSRTEEFLQSLFEAGVLKRELYDKIVYCPSCDAANVSMHYCCPHCKSFDIRKSALIEHIQCGYIDTEEKFRKDDKLVCPRCRKELTKPDVDYHKAGVCGAPVMNVAKALTFRFQPIFVVTVAEILRLRKPFTKMHTCIA